MITYLNRMAQKVPTLQVLVDGADEGEAVAFSSTREDQSFHSASIGKVLCATCVMMAVDEKKVTLRTPIKDILNPEFIVGLFIYKGVDYKDEVTLEHLLGHTSGVNDYFEGRTLNNEPFLDTVFGDPTHLFTPRELVDFTRRNQEAVGRPGQVFLYSDTGYVLLGFVLETLYGKPYADVLKEKIYRPSGMKATALCFHDETFDQKKLAPLYFGGREMSQAKSLSCDYSGGGLQTTAKDLARFLHALFGGLLIKEESLNIMMTPRHRFHGIMRYGLGMIEVKLHRVIPWKIGYPPLYGGLGSLSVHAFYDPEHKTACIINLGDASKMRQSFMVLSKLMTFMKKDRSHVE